MGIERPTQHVSDPPVAGITVETRAMQASLRTSDALRTFQSIDLTVSSDAAALSCRGRLAALDTCRWPSCWPAAACCEFTTLPTDAMCMPLDAEVVGLQRNLHGIRVLQLQAERVGGRLNTQAAQVVSEAACSSRGEQDRVKAEFDRP